MEPRSTTALIVTEPRWRFYVRDIAAVVARAMGAAGCQAGVVLTDDITIKRLNARDRGRNKPTNVLTYESPPEILLAFGVVLREARMTGISMAAHLSHLLIHGALHLAGYDHDRAGEARRMENAETLALARIGIRNPWKNK